MRHGPTQVKPHWEDGDYLIHGARLSVSFAHLLAIPLLTASMPLYRAGKMSLSGMLSGENW